MSKRNSTPEQELANAESRESFSHAGEVAFLDREFEKQKRLHNQIDKAFEDEIQNDDWTELKRTLKYEFPDCLHSKYSDLSANQKLFAVADALGWSKVKFSEISGVARSTLLKWEKRADLMLFARDFKTATGAGDPAKHYSALSHKSLRFYDQVLDMPARDLDAMQFKFKVASYVTDKVHKNLATGPNAVDLKSIAESLRTAQIGVDDDELFSASAEIEVEKK